MTRFTRTMMLVVVALTALMVSVVTAPGAAQAEPKLPENYNFFGGIPHELSHPNGSLPGSNDFDCEPSKAHPNPVVLTHGTGGGAQTNWGAYVPMLKNAGFCVFALTYGSYPGAPWPLNQIGGTQPLEKSAAELKVFVDKVRKATGAEKVDIVGHSQGTIMPSYYAKFLGGRDKIDKYVSLAPLWRGTYGFAGNLILPVAKRLGIPEKNVTPIFSSLGQMLGGSQFIKKLWADGGPYLPGIDYTNISTRYDEAVVPYTSGQVAGGPGRSVKNIVVQDGCAQDYSEHAGVAGSKRAAYFVYNALDPEHPRTVPCRFAAPFTG